MYTTIMSILRIVTFLPIGLQKGMVYYFYLSMKMLRFNFPLIADVLQCTFSVTELFYRLLTKESMIHI